jgi:hypothetical protein
VPLALGPGRRVSVAEVDCDRRDSQFLDGFDASVAFAFGRIGLADTATVCPLMDLAGSGIPVALVCGDLKLAGNGASARRNCGCSSFPHLDFCILADRRRWGDVGGEHFRT